MTEQDLIEQLADKTHESWSRWMNYLFSKCLMLPDGSAQIPPELVLRWKKQTYTDYEHLSEAEKQSDREEVKRILPIINKWTLLENDVE